MPEHETVERAREDAREGKAPSTQAGECVREEIHHVREGKHGARSTEQAIAIGLSKARRGGEGSEATEGGGEGQDGPHHAPDQSAEQALSHAEGAALDLEEVSAIQNRSSFSRPCTPIGPT